jgi:hypothetical protein
LSEQRDRAREPLVQVAVAENPATAQMIQDLLKQAGVRSLAKNTDSAFSVTGVASLPFTIEIFVLEGDAGVAEAILSDSRPARPEQLPAPKRRYRRRS